MSSTVGCSGSPAGTRASSDAGRFFPKALDKGEQQGESPHYHVDHAGQPAGIVSVPLPCHIQAQPGQRPLRQNSAVISAKKNSSRFLPAPTPDRYRAKEKKNSRAKISMTKS